MPLRAVVAHKAPTSAIEARVLTNEVDLQTTKTYKCTAPNESKPNSLTVVQQWQTTEYKTSHAQNVNDVRMEMGAHEEQTTKSEERGTPKDIAAMMKTVVKQTQTTGHNARAFPKLKEAGLISQQ